MSGTTSEPKHSQQFGGPDCELRWRELRRDYGVINAPKSGKCQRIFGFEPKKCIRSTLLRELRCSFTVLATFESLSRLDRDSG